MVVVLFSVVAAGRAQPAESGLRKQERRASVPLESPIGASTLHSRCLSPGSGALLFPPPTGAEGAQPLPLVPVGWDVGQL